MYGSLTDTHNRLVDYLKNGKFVEGIADFYDADVVQRENSGPPAHGRDHIMANERRFQKKLKSYHGIDVHARVVDDRGNGNGTIFYEATMKWEQIDRLGTVVVDQAVVEQWKNGKIVSIRFYGNYDPGKLPD